VQTSQREFACFSVVRWDAARGAALRFGDNHPHLYAACLLAYTRFYALSSELLHLKAAIERDPIPRTAVGCNIGDRDGHEPLDSFPPLLHLGQLDRVVDLRVLHVRVTHDDLGV
jgi:hypothetical protein